MGWLSELNNVYDRIIENSDIENKPLPLYHISNNAPLEITLNGKGEFRSVRLLGNAEKNDWQTCMPCTEESAARTGSPEPYPFCDKLEFVAGDYSRYFKGKNLDEKYDNYLALLGKWTLSKYTNLKILSVYNYVKKGTLIKDILMSGKILEMNTPDKISKYDAFVRWNVEIPGEKSQTWLDPEIQQLWVDYYARNCSNEQGLCYVSGKKDYIANLHSKKIRYSGDGAKLISSSDLSNYTYRGRFIDANQACQIGMEVSGKAHNALRWLIERQGAIIGSGLTVVAWCMASNVQPQLLKSSHDSWGDEDDNEQDEYYASEKAGNMIKNRLRGYYGVVPDSEKILIMVLNAATKGRMSILLYREFIKSDFCDAQEYWHNHLAWFYTYFKKGEIKPRCTISAPSPEEIAKTAYGKQINDNVKTMVVQRLLPCIIDKTPIPIDIEQLCFSRASRLNTLDSSERYQTLETACAVIKYNLFSQIGNRKEYAVGLEEERKDRDYLYGRLLAVADRVEARVLYQRKEKRDTNAIRYMQRFTRYPCSTWEILYVDKLRPYFKQLGRDKSDWYESLIREIKGLFDHDDYVSDKKLSGEFLLGYHCQLKAFWDGIAKAKQKDSAQPEPDDKLMED